MTPDRFRACLAVLDWTQRGIASLLGINFVTVQRWATGKLKIPSDIAAWLETLARCHEANPRPERSW